MLLNKFGRCSKKPPCVITRVIQSPASEEYVKKMEQLCGSLNMGGNKVKNVGEPSSDHDVATKAYVDSNSGARKIGLFLFDFRINHLPDPISRQEPATSNFGAGKIGLYSFITL